MNNFWRTHVCASNTHMCVHQQSFRETWLGKFFFHMMIVKFRNHVLWSQLQNKCGVCSKSAIGKLWLWHESLMMMMMMTTIFMLQGIHSQDTDKVGPLSVTGARANYENQQLNYFHDALSSKHQRAFWFPGMVMFTFFGPAASINTSFSPSFSDSTKRVFDTTKPILSLVENRLILQNPSFTARLMLCYAMLSNTMQV